LKFYINKNKMNSNNSNQKTSRRNFIGKAGIGIAALTVAPSFTLAGEQVKPRKIHIGIIGGRFGAGFEFHEHPDCIVEAVSDLRPDRRKILMDAYRCSKSYESLEKLILDPKIEAVFIATPAPDHVRHVVAALNAGKHVLCAVPAAYTIEECYKLKEAVNRTGLTYMMAQNL
jgi:predicted dehydrogenase